MKSNSPLEGCRDHMLETWFWNLNWFNSWILLNPVVTKVIFFKFPSSIRITLCSTTSKSLISHSSGWAVSIFSIWHHARPHFAFVFVKTYMSVIQVQVQTSISITKRVLRKFGTYDSILLLRKLWLFFFKQSEGKWIWDLWSVTR